MRKTVQMEEDGVATQMQESQNINEERTGQVNQLGEKANVILSESSDCHEDWKAHQAHYSQGKGRDHRLVQVITTKDPPDDDKDHDTGGTGDPMTDVVYDEGQTSAGLEVVEQ
nr:hypothetical protein Iba_chr08bCG4320 [Ipomoea batatas]